LAEYDDSLGCISTNHQNTPHPKTASQTAIKPLDPPICLPSEGPEILYSRVGNLLP
jgi:hypothetical protein